MENETQLDSTLLSIYKAKTTDQLQSLITKNIPLLLRSLDPSNTPKPLDQKKVIKTINDVLVFIKKRDDIKLPYDILANLILKSSIPIQKNVAAIFLKLATTS